MRKFLWFVILLVGIDSYVFAVNRNYDIEYSYVEAIRNRENGNLNASAYILTSILRVDSVCAVCNYDLSRMYRDVGSLDLALNYAARAYKLDSSNYWYARNFADLRLMSGDTVGFLRLFRRVIEYSESTVDDVFRFTQLCLFYPEFYPVGKSLIFSLGRSLNSPQVFHLQYLYRKKAGAGFSALNSFLDSCTFNFPNYPVFLLERAVLFAENRKFKRSRDLFFNIMRADTFSFDVMNVFSMYFKRSRDVRLVYRSFDIYFSDSLSVQDKQSLMVRMMRSNNPVIDFYLADRLRNLILSDTFSIAFFDELFNYFLLRNRMDLLLFVGKRFVELYPDNVFAWGRYLLPLYAEGQFQVLDSLLLVRPSAFSSPFGQYVAGLLCYNRKDYLRARNYLVQSLNVSGNFGYKTYAVNLLSDYYFRAGQPDSSFYYFEKAIQEDFADEVIMNNYAYYLSVVRKNLNRAEILARAAVMRYPKNSAFLDTYAWVLFRLRRYDEALFYMRKSLKYSERQERREIMEHYAAILYCSGYRSRGLKLMHHLFPDADKFAAFFKSNIECE